MAVHRLKTVDPYFSECWSRNKPFEVRLDDRNYQEGDEVYLREYDAVDDSYSGREIRGTIKYVLRDYPALKPGYVAFSYSYDQFIKRG